MDKTIKYTVTADANPFAIGMQRIGQVLDGIKANFTGTGGTFGQVAQGMSANMKAVGDSVASSVTGMGGHFSGLLEGVGRVSGGMTALIGVAAALGAAKAAQATAEMTESAMDLARVLGTSTNEAQAWSLALQDVGATQGDLEGAAKGMSKQLKSNEADMNAMGLVTRDAAGNLRPMTELLADGIGILGGYAEGADRAMASQDLFGRGVDASSKLLLINADTIDSARQTMSELGLEVGANAVAAWKDYDDATDRAGFTMKGLGNTIGTLVMPVVTQLINVFNAVMPAAIVVARGAIGGLVTGFHAVTNGVVVVWETIKAMIFSVTEPIRSLGAGLFKLMTGDFKGAAAEMMDWPTRVGENWAAALDKMTSSSDATQAKIAAIWAGGDSAAGTPVGRTAGTKTVGAKAAPAAKDTTPSALPFYEEMLAAEKVLASERDALHGMSKQAELKFWADILATAKLTADEQLGVSKKVSAARLEVLKQEAQEANELGKIALGAWEQRELAKVDADQEGARQRQALGQASSEALLQQEMAFEERRKQVRLAALEANRAALDPERDVVQLAQIHAQIESLEAQHGQRMLQMRGQILQQQAQQADALGKIGLQAWQQRELAQVEMAAETARQRAALGLDTQDQLLQAELQFEQRRYQIRQAALEASLAAIPPDKDPVAIAALHAELEALEQQHQLRLAQIRGQIAGESSRQMGQIWSDLGQRMSGLWDAGVNAMMNGTLTWRNAMRAVGAEMVGWFAGIVKRQVTTWIFGEQAKTGATAAGTAQRWVMESWAAAKSVALWAATAVKNIMVSAWEAMAAAWKAVAGIPYVGPVLAVAAAGAAFAGVSALARNVSSAEGGYDIPAGVDPLMQLHEREMVLPAKHADVIRSLADGGPGGRAGGGGGGDMNITFKGTSVGDFMLMHKADLVKALQSANRDGLVRVR